MEPNLYYPTTDELLTLGFFEGYGELWVYEAPADTTALISMDECGTTGYIVVAQKITHEAQVDSLADIVQLIASAKSPF